MPGKSCFLLPGRSHFLFFSRVYILFSVFLYIYFGIVYIGPTHHSFDLCSLWLFMLIYLVYEYFFSSQRDAAFCSKHKFSLLNCHIFCPSSCYYGQNYQKGLKLLRRRIVTGPFALVYQFYFRMFQLVRSGFLKSLFLSYKFFHIVLKFYIAKVAKVSLENILCDVISKIYFFNFMVSYHYTFCPRIGINEKYRKYPSRNKA